MADQDFKILITTEADNSGFASAGAAAKGLETEMGVVNVTEQEAARITSGAGQAIDGAAASTEKFTLKGKEMHAVIGQLNKISPGLGTAFKGIVSEAGPLIVVVLAIQAAMEWYAFYQEKAKAAAEALTAALDKQRKAFHEANDEAASFRKEMEKASEPNDKFSDSLARANAELDAKLKVTRELLKASGASDAELSVFDSHAEQQKIALKNNVIASAQADQNQAIGDRNSLDNQRVAASKSGNVDEVAKLTEAIKKLDERITHDQSTITKLSGEVRTDSNVAATDQQGRQAAQILQQRDQQTGLSLLQLEQATGKSSVQILNTVKALQDRHLTLEQAFAGLKQQLANSHFNGK